MKLILFILLITQLSIGFTKNKWVCSDKLNMEMASSSTNERGVWIFSSEVESTLSFDIDNIDRLNLYHIEYKNKNKISECEWQTVRILHPKFYLHFEPPFNIHKITVSAPQNVKKFDGGGAKRYYMLVVSKIVNGKRINYFKNFTFNIR